MATARDKLDRFELMPIEFVLRDKLIDLPQPLQLENPPEDLPKGPGDSGTGAIPIMEYIVNVPSAEILPLELDTSATG